MQEAHEKLVDELTRARAPPPAAPSEARTLFEPNQALPRLAALYDARTRLAHVEATMSVIGTLVRRQEHSLTRLEDGTVHMETRIERAREALARQPTRGASSPVLRQFLAVLALCALFALLLV